MDGFRCARCAEVHAGPPLSFDAPAPVYWFDIPEADRESRSILGEEQCEIDGQHFFVRGRISIPIHDGADPFVWGVWVSLSQSNYERMSELWYRPGRETEPPYFGWLSTELAGAGYPSTLSLKTLVHTRPVGERPIVELEPTDHPLALEQRCGITMGRVREIAELLLHQ